jgi:hypothetical protein
MKIGRHPIISNRAYTLHLPPSWRTHPLARAAYHEAGHAIAAICYSLPLREVLIDDAGIGTTRYWGERFGLERAEPWTVVTFAGPEAEFAMFHDRHGEPGDLHAIAAMMQRLGLVWSEQKLLGLRHIARRLVERERSNIATVASMLIRHRHLTIADLNRLLSTGV